MANVSSLFSTSRDSTKANRSWRGTSQSDLTSIKRNGERNVGTDDSLESVPDDELSILEYARRHELCKDFASENPLQSVIRGMYIPTTVETSNDLQDPDDVFRMPEFLELNERFEVDKDTATVLTQVLRDPGLPDMCHIINNLQSGAARGHGLFPRLELPLLKTDPELDMLRFCRRSEPDLQRLVLLFEYVDQERGEGYDWPTSMHDLPQKVTAELAGERLQFPKETIDYLLRLQRDDHTTEDEQRTIKEQWSYAKAPVTLTPPLLPIDSETVFIGQSPPRFDLERLSPVDDPTEVQVKVLHAQMENEEVIQPSEDCIARQDCPVQYERSEDMAKLYSPFRSIMDSSSFPSPKRKMSDLKVEVPLTPAVSSSPLKKVKTTLVPDLINDLVSIGPTWEKSDPNLSPQNTSSLLFDALHPLVGNLSLALEQEQLHEADSTMRVTIPVMEFPPSQRPWKVYTLTNSDTGETELEAQGRLIQRLRREEFYMFKTWPGNSHMERTMQWQPFPGNLRHVIMDESMDDKTYVGAILDYMSVEDLVTSDNSTWKQDGFRILDETVEEEEELQPGIFDDEEKDLDFVVRKRRLDMADEDQDQLEEAQHQLPIQSISVPSFQRTISNPFRFLNTPGKRREKDSGMGHIFDEGSFSASRTLDRFLILGGEKLFKKPKLANTASITQPSDSAVSTPPPALEQHTTPLFRPLALPPMPQALPPRTYIISVAVLQSRRSLFRKIESFYPNAKFIERDVSALATTPDYIQSSPRSNMPVRFDPAVEADVILSPSTGLVLTSLQKIQQRSLPGQGPQQNPFHHRLGQIVVRYERLIVLVSQGTEPPSKPNHSQTSAQLPDCTPQTPTTGESLALAKLHALVAGVPSDVTIHFVPGGESHLAAWAVLQMAAHGSDHEVEALETLWEQFLRRAGMNAFAAQVVLVALKLPNSALNRDGIDKPIAWTRGEFEEGYMNVDSVDTPWPSSTEMGVYGLRAFVRMGSTERFQRFEGLLGGRRVLERLNECLGRGWISESTGFR